MQRIVAGQLHGGVAQGIGQALMEQVSYDASGQPITGSFMDYALPRAEDIPPMEVGDHPSPAKSNPLGTKGCGEAGCAGSLVCIVNAVVDALSEYGITHIDMPLTPGRVWRATQYSRDVSNRTARPRRTGCPAFAGHDELGMSRRADQCVTPSRPRRRFRPSP